MKVFWGEFNFLYWLIFAVAILLCLVFINNITYKIIVALGVFVLGILCSYHFFVETDKKLIFCYGGFLIIKRKDKLESIEFFNNKGREKCLFSFEGSKFKVPFFVCGESKISEDICSLGINLMGKDIVIKSSRCDDELEEKKRLDDTNYEELLSKLKRNAIKTWFTDEVRFSKIGGHPDVPRDFVWPEYLREGGMLDLPEKVKPLSFVCQIDLEEVAQYDLDNVLPRKGVISVFYEHINKALGTPYSPNGLKVYYFPNKADLVRSDYMYDVNEDDDDLQTWFIDERYLNFWAEDDYPSCDTAEYLTQKELPNYYDQFDEEKLSEENYCTQMLGWPIDCQGSAISSFAEPSCDTTMIQLLQLHTVGENPNDFSISACGQLYIFISKADLENLNFDNVKYDIMF